MLTIIKENVNQIEVDKSKFIAISGHIESKDEFSSILDKIKKDYPLARHYCYALTTKEGNKYSDDGEPSGTAGKPLMQLLQNYELVNSYVVVVRYFGGVKLGVSRLLRTYVDSAKESLVNAKKGEIRTLEKVHLVLDDGDELNLLNNLKGLYGLTLENIIYNIKIEVDVFSFENIKEKINTIFKGKYEITNIENIEKILEI